MIERYTIGWDNGSSGSIGILGFDKPRFLRPVVKAELSPGKKGGMIQRLDRRKTIDALHAFIGVASPRVILERPFTGQFANAVIPAQRFFEAQLCMLEDMGLGWEVVDSRGWQAAMLGKVKGSAALKAASLLRGIQLYPQFEPVLRKQGDADGLLIAHHYHYGHNA